MAVAAQEQELLPEATHTAEAPQEPTATAAVAATVLQLPTQEGEPLPDPDPTASFPSLVSLFNTSGIPNFLPTLLEAIATVASEVIDERSLTYASRWKVSSHHALDFGVFHGLHQLPQAPFITNSNSPQYSWQQVRNTRSVE